MAGQNRLTERAGGQHHRQRIDEKLAVGTAVGLNRLAYRDGIISAGE